jgi:riboflavin biosynthesis pyrimidine reductase
LTPLGAAGPPVAAAELLEGLGLREAPRVIAAMIASADGHAAIEGRSVGLGHPADRGLLRTLRASADAVLVGAATVRAERYANLFDLPAGEPAPVVAVATRGGDVPWEVGMFAEPDTRITVYAGRPVEVPEGVAAQVEVRQVAGVGEAIADLHGRAGLPLVLCEGGPRLLRSLLAEGLLDELLLTVAPLAAAGEEPPPLVGPALAPPARLELAGAWRADDHLFLRYRTGR